LNGCKLNSAWKKSINRSGVIDSLVSQFWLEGKSPKPAFKISEISFLDKRVKRTHYIPDAKSKREPILHPPLSLPSQK
jgi:hypothetical protein